MKLPEEIQEKNYLETNPIAEGAILFSFPLHLPGAFTISLSRFSLSYNLNHM